MRLPRRPRLRAALACAIAALSLVWAAAAPAAPLPGSLYDSGDGNQDNALGLDWQGAYAAGAVDESPDANDDCFVGGVKELAPDAWAFNTSAGGCTPGKSNVRVAYANPESSAATTFGNFAFFRNDTTGNTFLTFELNQAATSWTNSTGTTIPCRSNGDLLLSFEVGGSSLSTVLYRWVGDGSGPAACPNGAAGTFVGSGTIPASRFQGAMNSAAASVNYVNPAAYGALFPANAFGEAAVDLPAVLQSMGQSPCFGFLQMHVHSRSSSSISSAMIDYTKPVPVRLQSCSITGTEFQDSNGNGTRDGGEPGVAGFEVYADLDDDGSRDAGEPTGTSGASGFYRILGVPAGSYKIRQVARSGWKCSAPDPCLHSRSLVTGGNSTGNDFGNVGPSTAAGTAFEDLDADGTRDAGEPALAGVVAYADLDGDAVADAGEPSGTSDSAGDWSISDIPAGTHAIRTAARSGWTCSAPSPCGWQRTFSSGSSSTGLQFGEFAAASLAGNVFEDVDGDGAVQAGGDAGLASWQVYLDANANDTFDIGETQTLTTAGGAYAFSGLAPGAYVARVTAAAANWYCTRPAVAAAACERASTLTSGQTATGQTFGVARTATVSGTKFNDIAGNGIKDGSDGALAGFEFWVDYDNDSALDAGEPSATSDAAGNWAITTARAGSWTLREVPNGAYQCTKPSPCTYALTLASNASASGYQFGNYVSRSVSGVVFDDADADGLAREAGEAGLAGWFVYSDANSNSAYDAGEPSSTSNSLGQYNLTGLANGNYRIRLVSQAGWTCSYPAGCLVTGSIGSGQSDTGMNFGVWGPSSIGGSVYEDADADGAAREAGEAGLAGRVVYIDANANAAKDAGEASATTDASGDYTLGGVNPGTYTLRLVATAGWTCSRPATCSFSVTTSAGSVSGRDFASYTTASVAGHVYEDLDADGARDGGEPAIAGRSVYLDADGDGIKDAGEPATTTDASGDYAFSGLAPAAYAVRQVLTAGWTQSAPASAQTIAARSGSATTATSLGSYAGATITGTIFEDADFDNSAREAGEAGVAGRAVYLDEDGDATQDDSEPVAATGPSGAFTFDGLKPGAYTVRATPPAGWTCAYPASCAHDVTVVSRATSAGNDFGTYLGASVTGTVFEDADADGAAREAGEAGVAGRRVYLDADADATRDPAEPTTLTTASGTYEFTGVVARGWTVRLDLDGAWSCDSPAGCAVDVTLSSGSAHDGADFGIHASGSISGHLFTDRDDDGGPQVFGENDQPGRTVYADTDDDGTLDAGEPSATTDDRGDYTLTDLAPGSYRVRQVLPAGWSCSTPSPCSWTTALSSRENAAGRDFSSWTAAAFSGTVFEDSAGDGEFPEPGEPGLAGRTIYIDVDDDAQLDAGEPATATDAEGRYAFAELAPGDYEVRAAGQPAGWTCSYPATCAQELTLEAGETAQDVSFGAWTTGTVAGVAYDDADASGSQDAGEPGIAGRTVWADLDHDGDQDGGEPAQVTDATGAYSFTLDPGGYMLREKAPAGWTCTAPALCGVTVTVTSRGATHDVDFGTRTGTGAVAGTIYEDADGDHTRDAGDDGVAAATVYVDGDDDGSRDAGEPTQTTDADGAYRFASLPAGDHAIAVERPSGWLCITSGCARDVHVDPGDDLTGRDLALARAATISGTVTRAGDPLPAREVYLDDDGDGTRDGGEQATTTAADGGYELTGLAPGEHSVRIELPSNEVCSAPTGCVHVVGLTSGAAATGRDFAAYALASLRGAVVEDGDGDGVVESGDEPLADVGVYLDADGDGERGAGEPATTTAADGTYAFTGLAPDDYEVRLEVPAGFTCSAPAGCAHARTLGSGEDASALDFTLWRPGSIAGSVFNDRDGDGQRAAGEPPRAGIAVFLDLDDDGQADGGEPAASTGADGRYELAGVRPGAYVLRVVPGAEWSCTWHASCRLATAVSSGHATAAADLGLRKSTAPVAGDETSTGAAGMPQSRKLDVPDGGSITLLDAGGQPTLTVVIAGEGTYVLDPATAVVTFTPEPGFTGAAHPIAYRISDADGATSDATYTPTVDPPAAALESAPAAPPPAAVAAAPAEHAAAAAAPAPAVQCVSRRTMKIHWKAPRRTSLRSIRISVNGKLYAKLSGRARSAVIDMKGRPRQTVKVRITAVSRAGDTYGTARTYRPCRARSAAPPLPTLRLTRR